jgi:hypothetical protein
MNAHQRRVDKRRRLQALKILISASKIDHSAVYKAMRKFQLPELQGLGFTQIKTTNTGITNVVEH